MDQSLTYVGTPYLAAGGGQVIWQQFTPTLGSVNEAVFQLYANFGGAPVNAEVQVWSSVHTPTLLGTSGILSITANSDNYQQYDFMFASSITVTNGSPYELRIVNLSQVDDAYLVVLDTYNYPGMIEPPPETATIPVTPGNPGNAYQTYYSTWFAEGINSGIVPEPASLLAWCVGAVALTGYFRRKFPSSLPRFRSGSRA